MGAVTVGLDVGQRVDPTAIAVAELDPRVRLDRGAGPPPWHPEPDRHILVRHLERLPLGTPYPDVAERVAAICAGVLQATGAQPTVFVDATGVGSPLVDMLKAANVRPRVYAVYFTHGDKRVANGREVSCGKAWLVSRLQALLQSKLLHLPKTAEAEACARELLDYEIRVDADANDRYGAFKVGTHDDLVTALGLAVQPGPPGMRAW